ncbi:OmpA family protein [bacterium]|nr:OmpA family protein [bacterium]
MKRISAIFLALMLTLCANATFFNYPSDLMYVPSTKTLGNLEFAFSVSQYMATDPNSGYQLNTDWFEEDASFTFAYHPPFYRLKFEFTWVQYTGIQGVSGSLGGAQIKLKVFDDPLERFSESELIENPKLKYLPSIVFGMRNLGSTSSITPTGNDADYISKNSFFIVLSKYLFFNKESNLIITGGIGGREFVGEGKMKNNGMFFGAEYYKDFGTFKRFSSFVEYSSKGIGIGMRLIQKNITIKVGFSDIQRMIKSLSEDRGIAINFGVSYFDTLLPLAQRFGWIRSEYLPDPDYIKGHMLERAVIARTYKGFIVPRIIVAKQPTPIFPKVRKATETVQEEVRLVKRDEGIQLKTKAIQFARGSANILRGSYPMLDRIAQVIRKYQQYSVFIEGHSDNKGSLKANYYLSKNRADSVKSYLLKKLGSSFATKINTFSFAFKLPVASNRTDLGRKLNRRVDFYLVKGANFTDEYKRRRSIERSISEEIDKADKAARERAAKTAITKKVAEPKKKVVKEEVKPVQKSYDTLFKEMTDAKNFTGAIKLGEVELAREKKIIKKLKIKKALNELYFSVGSGLLKKNDKSGKGYLEKTSLVPNSAFFEDGYYMLGQYEYSNGNYDAAISYFKRVLENYKYMDPATYDSDDEAVFKIIACLIKLKNIDSARNLLEAFPKQYPKSELIAKTKLILDKVR